MVNYLFTARQPGVKWAEDSVVMFWVGPCRPHSTRVPPFNSTSCVTAQQSVVVIFEKIRKNVNGGSCSGWLHSFSTIRGVNINTAEF